ncbi:MAG: acetylornithine transaminase [Candidatus Nanopelagicales bacterium]|nr:acetylornithine transaminase [Candidatus Nanopelagicales bacterium]MCU0297437.1 acetylornithine transaminase [Candidatus Nanopelagicales bacterium]
MTTSQQWTDRWRAVMSNNYGTPPVVVVRGEGAWVWDADGKKYLDMVAGIAVNALGHAHPAIQQAVASQMAQYGHVSNLAAHPVGIELAERLIELSGRPGRVFFCNSGAEANEAAFKVARLSGAGDVLAAQGSFHGRTMGALSLTGQPAKREPFEPLVPGVRFYDYGAVPDLTGAAALIVEPIQGEAGVVTAPAGYLPDLRVATTDAAALLIADEVQTGIGRTGRWFASQGAEPDMVTLAKGLGGGLPIGALLTFGPTAELLAPGHHGSTFGGSPAACAAALAVLREIESGDLLRHVQDLSARITTELEAAPGVERVRGEGLLLGVILQEPKAKQVELDCRQAGLLVNAIGDEVIRLAPPLNLTVEQADRATSILAEAIA